MKLGDLSRTSISLNASTSRTQYIRFLIEDFHDFFSVQTFVSILHRSKANLIFILLIRNKRTCFANKVMSKAKIILNYSKDLNTLNFSLMKRCLQTIVLQLSGLYLLCQYFSMLLVFCQNVLEIFGVKKIVTIAPLYLKEIQVFLLKTGGNFNLEAIENLIKIVFHRSWNVYCKWINCRKNLRKVQAKKD